MDGWIDVYLKKCNNLVLKKYCILIYSTTYNMQYYQYPPHHHVTGRTGGLVGAIEFSYFRLRSRPVDPDVVCPSVSPLVAMLKIKEY